MVDDGVEIDHPAFNGVSITKISAGGNQTGHHATAVAALIIGRPNHGFSGGVAPLDSHLLDVDIHDGSGPILAENIATGIDTAVDQGAHIINLSIALSRSDDRILRSIEKARQNDIIIVAATKNDVIDEPSYPAGETSTIGISPITKSGEIAPLATLSSADGVTYGENISTAELGGGFSPQSGSSIATAIASGLIARCPEKFSEGVPPGLTSVNGSPPLISCQFPAP